MKDLVSVIVPVYNVSEYLPMCLESIINQSYKNIEIIVVNDGSTDNSLEIIKEYAAKDNRICYFSRENRGLLYTRIDGTNHSKGKYLMFVDSDDWIELETIETLYNKLKKYDADMVKCSYKRIYKDKIVPEKRVNNDKIYNEKNYNDIYIDMVNSDKFNSVWSQLINADIVRKNIINADFSISMGEDVEINSHLINQYKTVILTGDLLYNYRCNEKSISKASSFHNIKKRVSDLLKTYYNFSRFIKENSLENYKESLTKSIKVVNNHLLDIANVSGLKYKEVYNYIKEVFDNEFLENIRKNISNKDLRIQGLKQNLFLNNLYKKKYKLYTINLVMLSKIRMLRRKK